MSNWMACQDEISHKIEFDNFDSSKVNSNVKDQKGPPIDPIFSFLFLSQWVQNDQNSVLN